MDWWPRRACAARPRPDEESAMRRHIITTIALGAVLLCCPAARAQAPVPYGGAAYASMYGGMNYPSYGMSPYGGYGGGYGMYYGDPVSMVLQIRQGIAA